MEIYFFLKMKQYEVVVYTDEQEKTPEHSKNLNNMMQGRG